MLKFFHTPFGQKVALILIAGAVLLIVLVAAHSFNNPSSILSA